MILKHKSTVLCCAFHPTNGQLLATGSSDFKCRSDMQEFIVVIPIVEVISFENCAADGNEMWRSRKRATKKNGMKICKR